MQVTGLLDIAPDDRPDLESGVPRRSLDGDRAKILGDRHAIATPATPEKLADFVSRS
jgi:hypothetical protein